MKEHIEREFRTMGKMVGIYCSAHHNARGLCEDCERFLDYAEVRLEKCPYGEDKPTCANCPVHCYKTRVPRTGEEDHALRGAAHVTAPPRTHDLTLH